MKTCRPAYLKTNLSQLDPTILLKQPQSVLVRIGKSAAFEVTADVQAPGLAKLRYQWFRNGQLLPKEQNRRLAFDPVTPDEAGLYHCLITAHFKDNPPVQAVSQLAELLAWEPGSTIVYGTPSSSPATIGNCPGAYVGYVRFPSVSPPNGWVLVNSAQSGAASDPNNPNPPTKVKWFAYGTPLPPQGSNGCGTGSVVVPPSTCLYRFVVYFPTKVPAGPYSIQLNGFKPYP